MGSISGGNLLRIDGADLFFAISVIDNNGDAVVAAQTVEISIERLSDNKFWNTATSDFDLGAEPALISAVLNGTTGIYEYTLTGGWDESSVDYRIHIDAQNTVAFDFFQDIQLEMPNEIIDIKTTTDILASADGVGLADILTFLIAYMKGKIVRTGNSLAYKKQDGVTTSFTLTGTSATRTPT